MTFRPSFASFTLGALVLPLALPMAALSYTSPTSSEAWLQFDAYVDMPMDSVPNVATLNQEGAPEHDLAVHAVVKQVSHLIGVFQSASLKREYGYLGTLDEDSNQVVFTGSGTAEAGRVRLNYTFRSKTIFDKTLFGEGQTDVEIPYLKLPREPDLIYQLSMGQDGKNYCTDDYWNDEYDFYYFFDPDKSRCSLKGNTTDVLRVTGVLSKIPNEQETSPKYDRLYANKILKIALFYGFINSVNPAQLDTKDPAYVAMNRVESEFKTLGFSKDQSRSADGFRVEQGSAVAGGIDSLHDWYNSDRSIEVRILLADPDSQSSDEAFHVYFKSALETADIIDYDGHIGTPENLDLSVPALASVRFNPSKYQIIFFNGCSSYPYYKQMYFGAKGGSGNLDLITSGLEENASTSARNDMAFLSGFLAKKTISFETILREMEDSSGRSAPYFYGVSGN